MKRCRCTRRHVTIAPALAPQTFRAFTDSLLVLLLVVQLTIYVALLIDKDLKLHADDSE